MQRVSEMILQNYGCFYWENNGHSHSDPIPSRWVGSEHLVLCSFQSFPDRCLICDLWDVFYVSRLWAVLYFYHYHAIKIVIMDLIISRIYSYGIFYVHIKCHWVKYYWLPHMITPVSLNSSVQMIWCNTFILIYFVLRHKFRDKIYWSLATRKQ